MRTAIFFAGMMIANAIGKGDIFLGDGKEMRFVAYIGIVCMLMDIVIFIKEMTK